MAIASALWRWELALIPLVGPVVVRIVALEAFALN
jgi:hypothetical protein